jgi:hypothetical protein
MVKTTRILYGLHECFVLFPYERGSRRSRLVLRASALHTFCLGGIVGKAPVTIGAPLVLGELLNGGISKNAFVPILCSGQELNALKSKGAEWGIRHHRAQPWAERSLRFETGTRTVFGAYTAYYSIPCLLDLTKEGPHEANPRTGIP